MTQDRTHSELLVIQAIKDRMREKLAELRVAQDAADERHREWLAQQPPEPPRPSFWIERAHDRLSALGVPDDVADSLKTLEPRRTEALKASQAWWENNGRCLLLLGDVGVGKTTAAVWCLREAIAADLRIERPSGYESHNRPPGGFELASSVARMGLYGHDAHQEIERLCSVGTLVLDDFGRERLSDVASALFDEILTRRLGKRRCRTVITSNLGKVELAQRVGARIVDRLREHGLSAVLKGISLRGREFEEGGTG